MSARKYVVSAAQVSALSGKPQRPLTGASGWTLLGRHSPYAPDNSCGGRAV